MGESCSHKALSLHLKRPPPSLQYVPILLWTFNMHQNNCSAMENKDPGQSNFNSVITFDNGKLSQFLKTERIGTFDVKDVKDAADTHKIQCSAMDNKDLVQCDIKSAVSFDPFDKEIYNRVF